MARPCARNSSAVAFSSALHPARTSRFLRRQRLVPLQEFLHLHHVISERFGGRIDGRQSSADHHDRHAQLQIRDRIGFRRAGQLQRHQEIRRLPHAARQAVLHRDHRRPSRARAQRDVIEAQFERRIDRQRPAEAHAAEHRELRAPLQQQADDLQKILVPADRDAIFRHAAEARHHAVVQRFVQLIHVANRAKRNALAQRRHAGNLVDPAARFSTRRPPPRCGRRSSDDATA